MVDSITVSLFVSLYLIWQIRYYCETLQCLWVVLEGAARRSWWIAVSGRTDPGLWGAVENFLPSWRFTFEEGRYGLRTLLTIMWGCPKPCKECETIGDVLVWSCAKKMPTRGFLRKRSCSEWGRWDFGETWERIVGKRRLRTFHRKKSGCCYKQAWNGNG